MDTKELRETLHLLRLCSNKKALSPSYRSLEIGPAYMRSYANFGLLEVEYEIGVSKPIHIDMAAFITAVDGLGEQISLRETTTALLLEDGRNKIRLAKLDLDLFPPVGGGAILHHCPGNLHDALHLGGTSMGKIAGLDLLMLQDGYVLSTDNVSISCAELPDGFAVSDRFSLTQESAALLSALAKCGGDIGVQQRAIYFQGAHIKSLIKQGPVSIHDMLGAINNYRNSDYVDLPKDFDKALRLGINLGAKTQKSVTLQFAPGSVCVKADHGAADMHSEFVLDGHADGEISVDAAALLRALPNCDRVGVSFLAGGVLILSGDKFTYLLSAKG